MAGEQSLPMTTCGNGCAGIHYMRHVFQKLDSDGDGVISMHARAWGVWKTGASHTQNAAT